MATLTEIIRGQRRPPGVKGMAGRCVLWSLALVPFLLAGCTEENFWQPAAPMDEVERSSQTAEGSSKPSPAPPPRTLPQAIGAYFRCLCHGEPIANNAPTSQPAEPVPSKNPPAEGKSSETENRKQPDTTTRGNQREPSKNPPAAGKSSEPGTPKDPDTKGGDSRPGPSPNPPTENGSGGTGNGKESENGKEKEKVDWYSAHAQATVVTQTHDRFHSPYIGPNSLLPDEPSATSMTGTLFLDVRLWECEGNSGEVVFNPEIAGGRGLSNASGIAGFPNGEITRVGVAEPTPYLARLYLRQTLGFGGEQEKVEDSPNQIAGKRDVHRLTFTMGKFSATDLVDDNRYSHDPRTQFLPWSIMYNGAWDYPANVRGYTYGIGIDYNRKDWALRYGIFQEPAFANGAPLDPRILKANGQVLEWEGRYTLREHPGKLRLLAYLNRAHMGKYSEALEEMPVNPDVTRTRAYRIKYGFGLDWEQEVTKELGWFARLGWDDGHTESWAFTAIDRLAEMGLLLQGKCWCRPNDQVGLALAADGLAKVHRDYLAAGGLDFIIGDGRLNYGPEEIAELFYDLAVIKGLFVTLDFQEVVHPAYNRDRGPVSIGSLRVHYEF